MHIIYAEQHRLHATDHIQYDGYPFITDEVPARAEIILEAVRSAGLGPVTAPEDHGLEPVQAVHTQDYLDFLQNTYAGHAARLGRPEPVYAETFARQARRRPRGPLGLPGYYAFGVGSPILEGTWQAAYWSAQCALAAAGHVRQGEAAAYALCRPPGHHAAAAQYGGFCYLNNAAIAARALQRPAGPEAGGAAVPVAILDIDYHHGNGTQEIFYADPEVLFCSLHAHPDDDYPYYWGEVEERGEGAGMGMNRNWPLPPGTGDELYLDTLEAALDVVAAFAPQYLVVSAGLDIALGDPVGGFAVSAAGFRAIGARIASLDLPTVIVQEGGYLLERLGENAVALLSAFG